MTTINSHLTAGLRHARNHEYIEAVREFDLLLSSDLTHVDGLYYRGCAKLYLTQYESAIDDFDSAISSLRLSLEHELQALYKRGHAHHKLHQFDLTLDDYRQFIDQCKKQNKHDLLHKGFFAIGCTYATLNQHDKAVRYFNSAIKSSNGSSEDTQKVYYLHRGRALACCANYDEARADLNLVVQQSNDPFVKGCALNELGQHQDALREFDRLLENKSQDDNSPSPFIQMFDDHVRFRRGLSHSSLNFHVEALTDYQHILDRSNESAPSAIADRVFFRKGISKMALDDPHDALINFNKSISINAHQSEVFYARGMLHFTLGRHDAAVYDHRRAIELGESYPPLASISKTFYHTYYYKKLCEAEAALVKSKEQGLSGEREHRRIAEYKQQFAPYTNDPEATHQSARSHIEIARNLSKGSKIVDTVTLAVNELYTAKMLCDKYPYGVASERIVDQFVTSTMNGIAYMSETLEKCVLQQNWTDLSDTLHDLVDKSDTNLRNNFNIFRSETLNIQGDKAEMIKKALEKFKQSPQQQEFYTMLVIRLCNLFDATRAATTGIFQHALTGTYTKVSYIAKIIGFLFQFVPVGGEAGAKVFGICESGLKKLDETRIQNALTHVGCLGARKKLYEAADKIAEKLTVMYEWQIKKFPSSKEECATTAKHEPNNRCCCANCCNRCSSCLTRRKNRILNEREAPTMQTIAEYAISLILNGLTELKVHEVKNISDLKDFLVGSVCNLPYRPKAFIMIIATKIKPTDAATDNDHWMTYEFFRGPAIQFEKGDRRADKHMNKNKFGYRGASWNEENLSNTNPEKLEEAGVKKEVGRDNTS